MYTKNQAKAYATITLDLLYKMKIKINPEVFSDQMDLIFDLYEDSEVEELYKNMLQNNKTLLSNIKGRVNCYIVNIHNSAKVQAEMVRRFCNNNIELGKVYITPPGENTDKYYELIQDIRNKEMEILMINIYTILGMSEREMGIIIHLCRENNIILVEI